MARSDYDPLIWAHRDSQDSSPEHGFGQEKENPPSDIVRCSKLYRALSCLSKVAKVALVFLACWGVANLGRKTFDISFAPVNRSCSCGGTTVAEAKARGCRFTPLAIAWLPPHCIDMELANEFDKTGPGPNGEWQYFADPNGTIPMTREEVSLLADDKHAVFYTTQEWHIRHCVYTWMKHYRSKSTGVTIENRSNGIEHIKHCQGIFELAYPMEKMATMAGIELNADLV
jgi:hypothetical protein